ncbi:MAG TPA: hypothetical protein DD670_12830 [Planctomycetaceae bacterium]|nr:hypothetical protein [Planctomycetaceae bacterium]
MKTTTRRIAAACLFITLAVGCDRFGSERVTSSPEADKAKSLGNVAVIDLDAVAEQLGHKAQIQNAIRQRDKDYAEQLGVIKANYEQKLSAIKQETGETPTPEQSKYLVQSANEFTRSLQQNTAKAQQALGSYQSSLIQQYRAQVKQVAQEVAAERGLGIILTKSDTVLAHDMTVDITGAVVERIRAKQAETARANAGANANAREDVGDASSPRREESFSENRNE